MACKNHTIKVSDETWAAWSAHAARLGLSVTKTLCLAVSLLDATSAGSKPRVAVAFPPVEIDKGMPQTPRMPPMPKKYVPQPQLKDKWKAKK